jgi:fermentation-respiration switch protein FrsA (DUF1100 family)
MQRGMRGACVAAWAVLAVVLLAGVADSYVTGLARDNLSNAKFQRGHERVPSDVGVPFQDVKVRSGDLQLAGWWMPAAGPEAVRNGTMTIILVHGVGSTMGKMVRMWVANLHGAGYSLLAFDLRNHGASPDVKGGMVTYGVDEADDVAAAVAYVQDNAADLGVDPDRIVLYGGSMGAATVLNAGARHLPGVIGVLEDSSYASFTFQAHIDGAAKGYPRLLVDLVLWDMDVIAPAPPSKSRPDLAIGKIELPVLLLQCSDDQRVTQDNFLVLLSAHGSFPIPGPARGEWNEPCPVGLSKDHHLDGFMSASYNATVLAFLENEVQHPAPRD